MLPHRQLFIATLILIYFIASYKLPNKLRYKMRAEESNKVYLAAYIVLLPGSIFIKIATVVSRVVLFIERMLRRIMSLVFNYL